MYFVSGGSFTAFRREVSRVDAVLTRLTSPLPFLRHLLDHPPFPSLPSPPLPSAPLPNRQVRRSPTTGHGSLG